MHAHDVHAHMRALRRLNKVKPSTRYIKTSNYHADSQHNTKMERRDDPPESSSSSDANANFAISRLTGNSEATNDILPIPPRPRPASSHIGSKPGNKKSFVWNYFRHPIGEDGQQDRSRTQCLLCKSQLAFNASGTTTTMLNHLKSRHGDVAQREEQLKTARGASTSGAPSQSPGKRKSQGSSSSSFAAMRTHPHHHHHHHQSKGKQNGLPSIPPLADLHKFPVSPIFPPSCLYESYNHPRNIRTR